MCQYWPLDIAAISIFYSPSLESPRQGAQTCHLFLRFVVVGLGWSRETGQLNFALWSFPSSGFVVLNQQCGFFLRFLLKLKDSEYKESVLASMADDYCSNGPTTRFLRGACWLEVPNVSLQSHVLQFNIVSHGNLLVLSLDFLQQRGTNCRACLQAAPPNNAVFFLRRDTCL